MILNNKIVKPTAENKWEELLDKNEQINWHLIWQFNLHAMKENKIVEFNYKLLHNLIPHKHNLYKWKISNNPLCSFDGEIHDNVHLFVNCKQTKQFWLRFSDIVHILYKIKFSFNDSILIEGYKLENKRFKTLNFLIVYAKYAIYSTFIQAENRKLIFHELSIFSVVKTMICNRLEVEKECKN